MSFGMRPHGQGGQRRARHVDVGTPHCRFCRYSKEGKVRGEEECGCCPRDFEAPFVSVGLCSQLNPDNTCNEYRPIIPRYVLEPKLWEEDRPYW